MRFKQFISEIGNLGSNLYGADARHDVWRLPSIHTQGLSALHAPPGGFRSFGQIQQHQQNLARYQDEDYIIAMTLEKLASLAENVVEGIKNRGISAEVGHHYELAKFNLGDGRPPSDPSTPSGWITGLQENDIISGLFPRLKHEELARARQLGVMVDNPGVGFNFNVNRLRQLMTEYQVKLANKERGFHSAQHIANKGDEIMSQMMAPSKTPLSTSNNPWTA